MRSAGAIICGATLGGANSQLTMITSGGNVALGSLSSVATTATTVQIAPSAPITLTSGAVSGNFILSLGGTGLISWNPVSYSARPLTVTGTVVFGANLNPSILTLTGGSLSAGANFNFQVSGTATVTTSGLISTG